MNILCYLGHPAQFHFAKHTIKKLQADNHNVIILIKTKEMLEDLLKEAGLEYINIQPTFRKNNQLSIAMASIKRSYAVYYYAKKYKVDLLFGTDASVAHAAWLLGKTCLTTLEDDIDVIPKLAKATYPFTTKIVVPGVCNVGKWNYKKISYAGYMKLAYLHPNYFKCKEDVVKRYIQEDKRYCIIRLAKLVAHHDSGIDGLHMSDVHNIIEKLQCAGYNVYIHSERKISGDLEKYRLIIASADIHHILSNASLLISDSQSMSVEAAMLGTPSLRFSDFAGRIGVLEELEHTYGLTFGVKTSNPQQLYDKIEELLHLPDLKAEFQRRRAKMLSEKIDVTAFFTWFIENYPQSAQIMKENPDYQYNFK